MHTYACIRFSPVTAAQSAELVALLSERGYEGFEEGEGTLTTYIEKMNFDEEAVKELARQYAVGYERSELEETNWNAEWESGFEPVIVTDTATGKPRVAIRAEFHQPVAGVEQEIVITPRMSFGTGHHATTYQMVEQMMQTDLAGKAILDFGTGTGVLAILAAQLGASHIDAIDNDEWSIANAGDNVKANGVNNVRLIRADTAATGRRYDVILANINRNVIADNFSTLAGQLAPGGWLLLSGFLPEDVAFMQEQALANGFQFIHKTERNNWVCLSFAR